MGKRKNRHCQSKQEVLQRVRQKKAEEQPEKRKPLLKRQLQTVNSIRPVSYTHLTLPTTP